MEVLGSGFSELFSELFEFEDDPLVSVPVCTEEDIVEDNSEPFVSVPVCTEEDAVVDDDTDADV